jgi:hypothetical protein
MNKKYVRTKIIMEKERLRNTSLRGGNIKLREWK